ncbi:hypothetical protein CCAX7_12520 [Capsulimonas corticalis]|uniref:Uncharacterized protein n=1 Tax=Capsulimonas corticalis TaxID=2219043 RepID=A0A402D4H5_9BACT|nr:hypothetical protein CCAX7_12520 [Capsulimonas corticalis]
MEYVINIAIVGILAAILIPVFVQARGKARRVACASNMRHLYTAFAMYAGDHDGHLPPYSNNILYAHDDTQEKDPGRRHYPPSGARLTGALLPYTHDKDVWFCRDDSLAGKSTLSLSYPAGLWIDHRYSSYDTAWWMGLRTHPAGMAGVTMVDRQGKPMTMNASQEVMLSDEQIQQTGCGDWLYSHRNQFNQLFLDGHIKLVTVQCAK